MRRGAVIIAIVAALAITALWWIFVVSPTNSDLADTETEVENERAREGTLRQQIANLKSLKDREVSYLFAMGQMESAIPEFPDVDTFLEELNFLAHRTGVELSSISLATPTPPPEEESGPLVIPLSLNATGQYFEVLGFIYGLEAMERLVRVQALSLIPTAETTDDVETGPEDPDAEDDLSEGPRPRPEITVLSATISGAIFTKTDVVVQTPEEPEEEVPPEEGGDGEAPPEEGEDGTDGSDGGDGE